MAADRAPNPQAIKGDDYKKDGDDRASYGITITEAWRDVHGVWQPHLNRIEVYGDEALRNRILRLLQVHGVRG